MDAGPGLVPWGMRAGRAAVKGAGAAWRRADRRSDPSVAGDLLWVHGGPAVDVTHSGLRRQPGVD
jgi:hypothetical protein